MEENKNKKNLLLGVSGSVATIKLEQILNLLIKTGNYNIKVITTEKSKHFFDEIEIRNKLKQQIQFYDDSQEWGHWKQKGDPVLHIDLRKWADIFVIAPLSANTMAKIANLQCDNLLTCVARAWDFKQTQNIKKIEFQNQNFHLKIKKPFIVAPAMNTMMFEHPGTNEQIQKLENWGIIVMETVEKRLACNDYGKGAMAEPETIVNLTNIIKDI
ncbi:Flavoprotein [Pseudocohnilembus persalinus]|uniref:Flavoprotein n=1 Tax=Pseudocohnilembus persalinus TaxID=266149 RepID=A0A0V0QHZ8_PSEPJ|nr:Flavoprotein [Pseudocohnilembus persalinus]|eukprot:KRX01755.1 Flavoprotein [Pseudocohnilembus persalinus]